jgi:hypothetical protein
LGKYAQRHTLQRPDSGLVNKHSGVVNDDSGQYPKTFTIGRNPCSRQTGTGVHDPPELPFTVDRNTQRVICPGSGRTVHDGLNTEKALFIEPGVYRTFICKI